MKIFTAHISKRFPLNQWLLVAQIIRNHTQIICVLLQFPEKSRFAPKLHKCLSLYFTRLYKNFGIISNESLNTH